MASDAPEFADLVGQFRSRRRRARGRKLAYPVYAGTLALLIYGGPAIVRAAKSVTAPHHETLTTYRIDAVAPYALIGVGLLVVMGLARQALWRGPVAMSEADAAWMLPLPISRRRLLMPRYLTSGLFSVVTAGLLGITAAVVLHGYGVGSLSTLAAAGVAYAAALALLGLGIGAATERSELVASYVRRALGPVVLALAALGVFAAGAASRASRSTTGLSHTFGAAQQVGLGLIAAQTATYGALTASGIPSRALRQRSAVGTAVSSSAYVADLRSARLAIRSATHGRPRGLRLPPPRRPGWSIPWRDARNLLTAPAGFGWAAAWVAVGSSAFALAARPSADGRRQLFPTAIAMLCCYVATLPYTEATRLDADDFRRIRWSPYPVRKLTTRHSNSPVALATVGQVLAAFIAATWLTGRQELLAICAAVATAPAVAVAAMISAFRGPVPVQMIFGGPDIGFGPIGPAMVAIWYLLGPISGVTFGTLTALPLLHAYHSHTPVGPAAVESLLVGAVLAVVLLTLARQRAYRRYAA